MNNNGAWSQPTTAPASVQVHYHYLAGRYRDLSSEKGLGLVHSGIPSSSSNATLGGIPEGDRGEEGESNSLDGKASIHSSNGKAKSASNSLRAIARKSGIKDEADQAQTSSSRRLDDLFLGGMGSKGRRQKGLGPIKGGVADIKVVGEYSKTSGPHGAKHGSLRSYAEERIKAHELVEARIQRATDTGRLKWEAKAAMMNNSFGLAILLLTRAAQLGSVSASLSLSHLYSNGIVRGNKPVVVLVFRDPLRSLSWALEAARILQHRSGAKAKRRGESSLLASADADQPAQIVALLARLLRCKQTGITSLDEVRLPLIRRTKAGKQKPEAALVWASVCDSMGWLDFQLPFASHPVRDDGESIGPDDDELDPEVIKRVQARTQIALIEALVATRHLAVGEEGDEKALSKAQACWSNFASKVHDEGCPHVSQQGNLLELIQVSDRLLDERRNMKEALPELKDALDKSLVESNIPVASSSQSKLAPLESPSKRRAAQLLRRRLSLEELAPMDAEARQMKETALTPALLRNHSTNGAKPTSCVTGLVASAKSHQRPTRAISLQGNAQRPTLPSSVTMARLEVQPIHQREGERSTFQRVRRPSSVMSDSPSLLFASNDSSTERVETSANEAKTAPDEEMRMTSTSSVASSLWEAAPLQMSRPRANGQERRRVTSLYGVASVAPIDTIATEGSTTYDYDIEASLRRQQARRNRGDSNASISTVASLLSTNPSISESMAESDYAKGQFFASSTTNNINGFDLRLGGAADTLRRIRKTSCTDSITSRDGPTAPQLTDTLEQLIANSTSYKAASGNGKNMTQGRSRKNSNASMRSLTAFNANNQRQTSRGEMRPPSLYQSGRALSVFAMPTTLTDRSNGIRSSKSPSMAFFSGGTAGAGATLSPSSATSTHYSNGGTVGSALGSLKLLGRQGSSQSGRKTIPASMVTTSKESKTDSPIAFPSKVNDALETAPMAKKEPPSSSPNLNRRAFASIDPTHSGSATPKTMVSTSPPLSRASSSQDVTSTNTINGLDAALAEAEERSGLKTTSICMVCGQKVVNAPVSKSGDVFCSRDCRMKMKKKRAATTNMTSDKGKTKARD